jgi:hypothetical protein
MQKLTINNKFIDLSRALLIVVALILLVGNVFFWLKYSATQKELLKTTQALETQKTNENLLNFAELFIDTVLKAEGEIDFETRLQLENAVRNLNDNEILAQWQEFVGSKTEIEAQEEVKNLLEILVSKIKQ